MKYEELLKAGEKISEELAKEFKEVIEEAWPTDDTPPHSKDAWSIEGNTVKNDAPYSNILWQGRIYKGGRWWGSEQLPDGGDRILANFLKDK
jgi:hypothetical protein